MDGDSLATHATAFVSLGTLTLVQQLAGAVLGAIPNADPELAAEETLAMASTNSSRVVEVALRAHPEIQQKVVQALLSLPQHYHDYMVAEGLLSATDEGDQIEAHAAQIRARMIRKCQFYQAHLPAAVLPGEKLLTDKLALWVGRISPPGTGRHPADHLEGLGAVSQVVTHNKVVLAFCRRATE